MLKESPIPCRLLRVSNGPPILIPKRFGTAERRETSKATNAATSPDLVGRQRYAVWLPALHARPDLRRWVLGDRAEGMWQVGRGEFASLAASGLTLGLSFGAGGVGVGLSGLLADLFGLQMSVWLLVLLPGIAGLIALTLSPPRDRRA